MKKLEKLVLFLTLFLLFIPATFAGIADIYDFNPNSIFVTVLFSNNDSNANGINDSIFANVTLNETGNFLIAFDVFLNTNLVSHFETNSSNLVGSNEFLGAIVKVPSGNYLVTLTVSKNETLFCNSYNFSATNFESQSIQLFSEPQLLAANYSFLDANNNSLYDFLLIFPSGEISLFDSNDFLVVTTTNNTIDLKEFYSKKINGPFRIVIDANNQTYAATTINISHLSFEKLIFPDIYAVISNESVEVYSNNTNSFNFSVTIYENNTQILKQKIDRVSTSAPQVITYFSRGSTKVFADSDNLVDEENEDNNIVERKGENTLNLKNSLLGNSDSKNSFFAKLFKSEVQKSEEKVDSDKKIDEVAVDFDQKSNAPPLQTQDLFEENSKETNSNSLNGFANIAGFVTAKIDSTSNKGVGVAIMFAMVSLGVYIYQFIFRKE